MVVRALLVSFVVICLGLVTLRGAPPEAPEQTPAATPEQKIAAALQRRMSLAVEAMPLAEVAELLGKQAGIPIRFDEKGLADVGIATETPVTQRLQNVPLGSLLHWTLKEHDLTFVVRDEVLLITTPEEANARLETAVYDVKDLVVPDEPYDTPPGAQYDFDSLIDLITSTIAPTTWSDGNDFKAGGFGTALVIPQSAEVQEEIAHLLDALRRLCALWQKWDGKTPVPQLLAGESSLMVQSDDERRIAQVLREPAKWDFVETPLAEALEQLAAKHKIPVVIDRKAFADVGLDPARAITNKAAGVSLAAGLRRLLGPIDLMATIRHDVLVVTTPEEGRSYLQVRFYPVFDLVAEDRRSAMERGFGGGFGGSFISEERTTEPARNELVARESDSLIDIITSSVKPTAWDDVGGPCSCSYFSQCHALVVSATDETHEEIGRLLARLRTVVPIIPKQTADAIAKYEAEVVRRVYRIGADTPQRPVPEPKEIAEVIRATISPETWSVAGNMILVARGRLVIVAPRNVQRKIAELIFDLQFFPEAPKGTLAPTVSP